MNRANSDIEYIGGRRRLRPIVVRGGGDLATGTIYMLSKAGFPVIILECVRPTAIRRKAAFCEAVYFGEKTVEDIRCVRVDSPEEALEKAAPGVPVLLVDEDLSSLNALRPQVLVDAVIAKRNLGISVDMADLVIALGPGFTAGVDAHAVIETKRGHTLGRVIYEGSAEPNTGVPGLIEGYGKERVIHAPTGGTLQNKKKIGDLVNKDEVIAVICSGDEQVPVQSALTGVLRGILPDGFEVPEGMKMADVDPRASERRNCFTISDKARCIAGSVLMLVCNYLQSVI